MTIHYKAASNKAKSDLQRSKYIYEKNLTSKITTDYKLFWSYVRSKTKLISCLGELEKSNGTITSDSQEKTDILNRFFTSVFEVEVKEDLRDFKTANLWNHFVHFIYSTDDSLNKAVDKGKASNNINPILLKQCK